jgi:DNA gyrase subunit B
MNDTSNYGAGSVKSLEGVELVRARPSLFLGGLDGDGLHRLAFEAIDNAVDEFRAGFGEKVEVLLGQDGVVEVRDGGRGIPHGLHSESGLEVAVFLMTKSFAGAKFEKGAYSFSGGLHGVGLKCINAFSEWVELVTIRDAVGATFRFVDGVFESKREDQQDGSGTIIKFLPRYDLFGGATIDRDRICARLEDAAYLNPRLRCSFSEGVDAVEFYSPDGVKGLLTSQGCFDIFSTETGDDFLKIECHLGADPQGNTASVSYANGIPTPEGGSHMAGVKTGMARAINSYAGRRKLVKDSDPVISSGDVAEGCSLVVSLVAENPPFSSQKKTKVLSPEIETRCSALILNVFSEWLESNPSRSKHVVGRMLQAAKNREKLRTLKSRLRVIARAKKLKKPGGVLVGGQESKEILLCIKKPHWRLEACDNLDVLPLSPKTTCAPGRATLDKLLKNTDFFTLVAALGGGVGSPEDDPEGGFKIEACRYDRIVVDAGEGEGGQLAGAFVLSFMEHHLPGLIESERVFWRGADGDERVTTGQSLKSEIATSFMEEGSEVDGGEQSET